MNRNLASLPPGPRTPAAWQLLRYSHSPLSFLEACSRDYGDPFTIRQAGYGDFVMLASPDAVRDVFRGDGQALHSGEGNQFLEAVVGKHSVLVLDEATHARQRRILVPPLKGERMRSFFGDMQSVTLDVLHGLTPGRAIAMLEPMQEITLKVILRSLLGVTSATQLALLAGQVRRVLDLARGRYGLVFAKILPIHRLQKSRWLPFFRRLQELDATLFSLIERRRRQPTETSGGNVVDDLIESRHENGQSLSDEEIRDALVTLVFAGHDTTSIALAWILEQVASRPDVMLQITDELARVTGGRPASAEQLSQLAYLDAVIRESLRVRTILPFVVRLTKLPFVAGGREYPAGVLLCPCSHLVHRREDLYDDALAFRPERFLARQYAAHEWLPFGGGGRLCAGMAFAMYEIKVVLSTLFATRRLTRPEGARSWPIRRGISLAPSDGAMLTLD